MAVAGLVLGLVGAGVQAAGMSAQYGASAAASRYQAVVAENNMKIAKQNARQAVQTGWDQQYAKGLETASLMGSQKAAQGASGIDVASGSARSVRDSTYLLGRMDEMTIMKGATSKADAYMAQAMNYEAESGLHSFAASTADTAKNYAIASSLIGGATSFADKWMSLNRAGAFA